MRKLVALAAFLFASLAFSQTDPTTKFTSLETTNAFTLPSCTTANKPQRIGSVCRNATTGAISSCTAISGSGANATCSSWSPVGGTQSFDYLLYVDGASYGLLNGSTGAVTSGSDAGVLLQSAMTACSSSGCVIRLTGETFPLSATLWIKSGTTLEGAGRGVTILQRVAGTVTDSNAFKETPVVAFGPSVGHYYTYTTNPDETTIAGANSGSNFTIRDLTIDGNAANQTITTEKQTFGIAGTIYVADNEFGGYENVTIENVEVKNTKASAIRLDNTKNVSITGCYLHDFGSIAVAGSKNGITVSARAGAIANGWATGLEISRNKIVGYSPNTGTMEGIAPVNLSHVRIVDNDISAVEFGIELGTTSTITAAYDYVVSDNNIHDSVASSAGYGVDAASLLKPLYGLVISGNTITNMGKAGINLGDARNVTVTGNTLTNIATSAAGHGIAFSGSDNFMASGNSIVLSNAYVSYGIVVNSSSTMGVVSGNYVQAPSASAFGISVCCSATTISVNNNVLDCAATGRGLATRSTTTGTAFGNVTLSCADDVFDDSTGTFEHIAGIVTNDYIGKIKASTMTAARTWTMPNMTGTAMMSDLATNAADAANSIWGTSNGLVCEGATANAFETTITPTDPTADRTITLPDASGTVPVFPSPVSSNTLVASNGTGGLVDSGIDAKTASRPDSSPAGPCIDIWGPDNSRDGTCDLWLDPARGYIRANGEPAFSGRVTIFGLVSDQHGGKDCGDCDGVLEAGDSTPSWMALEAKTYGVSQTFVLQAKDECWGYAVGSCPYECEVADWDGDGTNECGYGWGSQEVQTFRAAGQQVGNHVGSHCTVGPVTPTLNSAWRGAAASGAYIDTDATFSVTEGSATVTGTNSQFAAECGDTTYNFNPVGSLVMVDVDGKGTAAGAIFERHILRIDSATQLTLDAALPSDLDGDGTTGETFSGLPAWDDDDDSDGTVNYDDNTGAGHVGIRTDPKQWRHDLKEGCSRIRTQTGDTDWRCDTGASPGPSTFNDGMEPLLSIYGMRTWANLPGNASNDQRGGAAPVGAPIGVMGGRFLVNCTNDWSTGMQPAFEAAVRAKGSLVLVSGHTAYDVTDPQCTAAAGDYWSKQNYTSFMQWCRDQMRAGTAICTDVDTAIRLNRIYNGENSFGANLLVNPEVRRFSGMAQPSLGNPDAPTDRWPWFSPDAAIDFDGTAYMKDYDGTNDWTEWDDHSGTVTVQQGVRLQGGAYYAVTGWFKSTGYTRGGAQGARLCMAPALAQSSAAGSAEVVAFPTVWSIQPDVSSTLDGEYVATQTIANGVNCSGYINGEVERMVFGWFYVPPEDDGVWVRVGPKFVGGTGGAKIYFRDLGITRYYPHPYNPVKFGSYALPKGFTSHYPHQGYSANPQNYAPWTWWWTPYTAGRSDAPTSDAIKVNTVTAAGAKKALYALDGKGEGQFLGGVLIGDPDSDATAECLHRDATAGRIYEDLDCDDTMDSDEKFISAVPQDRPPGYESGKYYGAENSMFGYHHSSTTAAHPTANWIYCSPFVAHARTTFDRIGIELVTAEAGKVFRLGIYTAGATGTPSTLVSGSDGGDLSADASGNIEATISSAIDPGFYWLCVHNNGASMTFRYYGSYYTYMGGFSSVTDTTRNGYYIANQGSYGALPATFPSASKQWIASTDAAGGIRIRLRAQ